MELFRQTNIDFLKYKWWAIGASWALILLGVFTVFVQKGLKFGIDFSGGTAIAIRFAQPPDIDATRKLLDGAGLGEIGIQRYEEASKNSVLIRVQQQATEGRDVTDEVLRVLRQGLQSPTDPGKIDINTEGKGTLATRLAAADPDHVLGREDLNPGDYYAQAAERIIAKRSELGVFRSPADAASAEGVTPAVKAWPGNTVTGCSAAFGRERRALSAPTFRRRPRAIFWSTSACSPTSRSASARCPSAWARSWRSSTTRSSPWACSPCLAASST
jgi:hypothetical protein